jgi:hypothetical protein
LDASDTREEDGVMVKKSICPRLWWLLGLLAVLTVAAFPASAASPTEDWTWATTAALQPPPPATAARFAFTATLLTGGERVLVAGGYYLDTEHKKSELIAEMQVFSLTSRGIGKWGSFATPNNKLRIPRRFHTATLIPGGKVLVAGGCDSASSEKSINDCELVDETTGEVDHTVQSLHDSRRNHTATPIAGGKVLVVGGQLIDSSGITYLNTAEVYDPGTKSWSKTPDLNFPRSGHKMAVSWWWAALLL